mgnify:CR=1 FL=1
MKALKQQLSKESVAGVLFTLPFTIGFLLFMLVPMEFHCIIRSVTMTYFHRLVFTGLKNLFHVSGRDDFLKH